MSVVPDDDAAVALPSRLSDALISLRKIVGAEHVLERWDQIEPRAQDTLPAVYTPTAIVSPGDVDEVRAVVAVARERKLPLWPISRGRNWAYGAATPNAEGMIVLTLERLNRIIEVNAELAYAVIEPGVTYAQLQEHLERQQIPLWIDPTDSTPHGSVIGNALDRGIGTTPYGDHFANLCGVEVVLADGRVLQSSGGPDSLVRHTYKWGTGPYLEGLFSQAGAGVVTQAGVWLMPAPEAHRFYVLEISQEEHLPNVVDVMRRMILEERVRTRIHLMNSVGRVALIMQFPFGPDSDRTHLSPGELDALRQRHGLPLWLLSGGIYGTHEQVRAQQRELQRALGGYGQLQFADARKARAVQRLKQGLDRARRLPGLAGLVDTLSRRLLGKSLEVLAAFPHAVDRIRGRSTEYFLRFAYFKSRRPPPDSDVDPARDGGGLVWFAPSLPLTGHHMTTLLDLCRPLFEEHGFDFSVALMPHNARSAALVMGIHYFKDRPSDAARAEALYQRLREVTAAAGYPQYRVSAPHHDQTPTQARTFWDVASQIQRALDPDGIIAPGRYGAGRTPAT